MTHSFTGNWRLGDGWDWGEILYQLKVAAATHRAQEHVKADAEVSLEAVRRVPELSPGAMKQMQAASW